MIIIDKNLGYDIPVIKETGISVWQIMLLMVEGHSINTIAKFYKITKKQVKEAINYGLDIMEIK